MAVISANANILTQLIKKFCPIFGFAAIVYLSLFFISNAIVAQPIGFNYQLKKSDYIIVSSTWAVGLILKYGITPNGLLTKEEIGSLSLKPVFNIDKIALGKYNQALDKTGDVLAGISIISPLLLTVPALKDKNWQQVATINIMYAEVLGITFGLAEMSKNTVQRIRPYMYNSNLTVNERYNLNSTGDGQKSFYSMHTAFAFSSAVFLSKVYTDSYGKNAQSKIIWAGSLGLASVIGISRISSGQHFPTDVVTGAILGGLTGYLVPVFHKNKTTKTALIITPDGIRVRVSI